MKQWLVMFVIAMGFVSAVASAGDASWHSVYSTSRHNIRVTCPEAGSDQCIYESWNKPRDVGQGKADLTIHGGKHILAVNGNSSYLFRTGNVTIELFDELRGDSDDSLDVSVNGQRKSHYHLTSR